MKRLVAIVAALGLVPVVAWTAASAGPQPRVDCVSPTTTAGSTCVAPAPAAAVEPVAAPATQPPTAAPEAAPPATRAPTGEPTTSEPATSQPTTGEPATSEPATSAPTSTAPPTTDPATSTTVDHSTTPTSADPGSSTTTSTTEPGTSIPPGSSPTSTTLADGGTTPTTSTTVDPTVTTTTVPPTSSVPAQPDPDEDLDSEPAAPPVEAPSGRVVVPAGAVESGRVRPITFPVAGPVSYVNDWGACRDGCRRAHKGNDLIGDRLQPILAMREGVVDRLLDHRTAGYGVVVRDDEGWEYHVYHLNNDSPGTDDGADGGGWRFLPGIVPGARVTAGQQIGWMGDSGNSEGSVPHAHVEIHTPEGNAINPYWSLRAAQRAANCAVGSVGRPAPGTAPEGAPEQSAPTTDQAVEALAAPGAVPQPDAAPQVETAIAATTRSAAVAADPAWLADGWWQAALPAGWSPFTVTGGRPGSGRVAARMWISEMGFTPVDAAALRVGDARYDDGVDCTQPVEEAASMPAEMAAILATIRHMESRGNYTVQASGSTASGAYGFLDSSWGGYGGYGRAKDAPPRVQDAKAAEFAASILNRNGGDVSTVPVTWYIGHVPRGDEWDTVPRPDAGNVITPREYQQRWMTKYRELLGDPAAATPLSSVAPVAVDTSATCRTVVIDVGTTDAPHYALTQAQSFLEHPDGRAVPDATDPCDPGRALTAAPVPAEELAGLSSGELLAKLEEPPTLADGPR